MNETQKRRNLAIALVQSSGGLMDVLYHLNALRLRGENLVFVDSDFTGVPGLEHLTAARVNAALATINTVLSAFVQQNYNDTFEAMRS